MDSRSNSVDNTCPLCHDVIEICAVGPCDHPVCYRCSTRMRVLCETADCPICRSLMPQVAFVRKRAFFKEINLRDCIPNRKFKIFYEDEDIEERYLNLLEFRCRLCPNRKSERTFILLQTHMRREHQLFACDLCLSHLKIFPYERKFYDRKYLATHRRVGDPDDKSYKGHPLCEFCDVRYNDKDELLKHLRKDHYYCHFCDQDGSNAYYGEYSDLKQHFANSHYLCTEDICDHEQTQFTHAFSSEIDLKAHKAKMHNKSMSKLQSKETRHIEVDFHLHPRRQAYGGRDNNYEDSRRGGRGGDRYNHHRRQQREDPDLVRALTESMETASMQSPSPVQEKVPDPVHDFPTLNGALAAPVQTLLSKPKTPQEDFPTLSMANSQGGVSQTQPFTKAYASAMNFIHENKPPPKEKTFTKPVVIGSVSSKAKDRWASQAPRVTEENFPSLGGKDKSSSSSNVGFDSSWSKTTSFNNNIDNQVSLIASKSFVDEKPVSVKHKSSKHLVKSIEDKNEFPSLEGSVRENGVLANSLWSKPKSAKKSVPQSRTQKVDYDFELPESYYKTYEPKEASHNDKMEEKADTNKVKSEKMTPLLSKSKDFPSLPAREPKAGGNSDKKNKTKPKEKQPEIKAEKISKSKKSSDGLSSLNDIAQALVVHEDPTRKVFNDKTNKGNNRANHQLNMPRSKPDWFDNPPVENLSEKRYKPVSQSTSNEDAAVESAVAEDNSFPSLHNMSTPIKDTQAPPGFPSNSLPTPSSFAKAAPPGFSQSMTVLGPAPAAPPPPPGFTSLKSLSSQYVQPADFSARNQQLIKDIHSYLCTVEDGFTNFKILSGQYRQGNMTGGDYYVKCRKLMGDEDFSKVFPELIVLLPDIPKQQELWAIFNMAVHGKADTFKVSKPSISPCPKCGQIVLLKDEQHHNLQHGEQSDFPALGDSTGKSKEGRGMKEPGNPIKGSWIKAK